MLNKMGPQPLPDLVLPVLPGELQVGHHDVLVGGRGTTVVSRPDRVYQVLLGGHQLHPALLHLLQPVQPVPGTHQGGVGSGHAARLGLGDPGDQGGVDTLQWNVSN